MTDHQLFAAGPGLALVSLCAVSVLRYLLVRQHRPLDRSALVRTKRLLWGSRPWRIALSALLAAHVILLVFPRQVLLWNQVHWRLLLLEGISAVLGVTALVGLLRLIVRHILSPVRRYRARPSLVDMAFLGLFLVAIVSGLATALLYRWASSWSTVTLVPYVRSLVALDDRVPFVAGMPYVVKLHVFSAIAMVGVLPFTCVIEALLYPIDRALSSFLLAPLTQRARWAWIFLESWGRRGTAALSLKREED